MCTHTNTHARTVAHTDTYWDTHAQPYPLRELEIKPDLTLRFWRGAIKGNTPPGVVDEIA